MVRLATEAEDERTRAICSGMVMDRAWGKPREYDPDKEAPNKAPPFDPKLYTSTSATSKRPGSTGSASIRQCLAALPVSVCSHLPRFRAISTRSF
jgi:hypothetical protein